MASSSISGSCATRRSAPVESFDSELLLIYANACSWALARAHAEAGDAATISAYLGQVTRSAKRLAIFRWFTRIGRNTITWR
jgi:hypothetical protein